MVKKETATFGAGCFWGIESLFLDLNGVISTSVGYMGGDEKYKTLSYEEVCTDETGHAEVIQIIYDSEKISYKKLLEVFWNNHDPTTQDRQGLDLGRQYRSVIFYYTEEQRKEAIKSKNDIQRKFGKVEVVTEIVKAGKFYKAEEYHQKYYKKKGVRPTCHY